MKRLISVLISFATFSVLAAPILQSPWTVTTDPTTARTALHAVAEMTGSATNLTVVSNNVIVYHGTVATPYRTLDLAKAAMVSGDKAYATAGVLDCSNHIVFPKNCALFGAGPGSTIIRNWFTNGTPAPLIAGSDNLYISDLQITNMWADPNGANAGAGVPSSCFGMHQNIDVVYTNATLNNVLLYGGSDTVYNRSDTGEISYKVVNSELHGPWDIATAFGTGKHRYKFFNTSFDHRPTASHNNAYDILVSSFTADALWELTGCTLYMSNGIAGKSSYYFGAESSTSQGARFINCVFTNAVPGNTEFNISTINPLSFLGCVGINMTAIGDGDPDPQINFGQLIGNSLNFGGDEGTTAHVLTNTVGGVSLNGGFKASDYTNSSITTGLWGADANGHAVKPTLVGATYAGTTLTITPGGFTTPFSPQFSVNSTGTQTNIAANVALTNAAIWVGTAKIFSQSGGTVTIQDPNSFSSLTMDGTTTTIVAPIVLNIGGSSVNINGITTITGPETVTGNVQWTNTSAANSVNMKWNQTDFSVTNPASAGQGVRVSATTIAAPNFVSATNFVILGGATALTNRTIGGNATVEARKLSDNSVASMAGDSAKFARVIFDIGNEAHTAHAQIAGTFSAINGEGGLYAGNSTAAATTNFLCRILLTDSNVVSKASVIGTNGVASYSTNQTLTVTATGVTNTLLVNYRIMGFTGVSVVQSNRTLATQFSRGTLTVPTDIVLQPMEALIGGTCAAQGVQAW